VTEPVAHLKAPEIPDKLYFRIGEVSRLAGIKPYVLRFWESEFPGLGPKKSGTGHRLYRRKDVELVLHIKHLLYEKRYTIEGARKLLEGKTAPEVFAQAAAISATPEAEDAAVAPGIDNIKKELTEILKILS
jgi:DNA-binding transcriptional MerR regulator